MSKIKKYLESIMQYPLPKTRALEQELGAVRSAHAAISADLAKLRENLQCAHADDTRRLVDLQQQVRQIESERNNASEQVEHLKSALADSEQRQSSMEADVSMLGAKLEEERSNARMQVEQLERALADSEQRQKSTETHVEMLETMLEKEHNSHEAGIRATETFLARMQSDQETHAKLLSELAANLQDITMRLQGTLQLQRNRPPFPLLKLVVMAVVLFVTGTLAGMFTLQSRQDGGRELAVVERDVDDMREFMKQRIDNQDTVLNELALALNRQPASEQAPVGKTPPAPDAVLQAAEKQPQNTVVFEADIRELQESLIALGFDLGMSKPNGEPGIKTRQALQEFREFYLPDGEAQDDVVSEPLAALILKSADRAEDDAAHFNIRNDVLAAIRMGSIRTGVDFSFLMELARVESNFNPLARAPRSSSTGLFQFKDASWLQAIRTFGADYGLEDYASRVKPIDDENHESKPIVRDPLQLEVLALRFNPRLSTLIAAEYVKRNQQILSARTGHEPDRTELYLAHYLGPDGAVMFLKALVDAPATIAGDIFPEKAASNPGVFQSGQGQPRTVTEVYRFLDSKFDTARYAMRNPG
jgi:peptidoglycan hydrolase-like protein with peptidoglycan-binding domain